MNCAIVYTYSYVSAYIRYIVLVTVSVQRCAHNRGPKEQRMIAMLADFYETLYVLHAAVYNTPIMGLIVRDPSSHTVCRF